MRRFIGHLKPMSLLGLAKDDLGNEGRRRTSGVGLQPLDVDVDIERIAVEVMCLAYSEEAEV
jgi:hypothetical protein